MLGPRVLASQQTLNHQGHEVSRRVLVPGVPWAYSLALWITVSETDHYQFYCLYDAAGRQVHILPRWPPRQCLALSFV
jgi:hypothetical protein